MLHLVQAHPQRRYRSRYTRPSRATPPNPAPPRKKVRTILEATIDGVLDYYSRSKKNARIRSENKIKVKVPQIKLKTFKKSRKRPRPHARRPQRQRAQPPPRDSREATTPSPPPPPPPSQSVTTTYSTSPPAPPPSPTPSVTYNSEPLPTKVFKFDISDAKPTKYSLLADTPVVHGDFPSEVTTPAPAFFLRQILDSQSFHSDGEIFPEEITNSLAEFGSIAGSDGKYFYEVS